MQKQADRDHNQGEDDKNAKALDVSVSVHAANAFSHGVHSIPEWHEREHGLEYRRQNFLGEGSPGTRDLQDHGYDGDGQTDILKGKYE